VLTSIHDNIHRYYDRFLSMDDQEIQENCRDLCDLVGAIESGAADDARRLARGHVQRFNGYMQRRAQEEQAGAPASSRRKIAAPQGDAQRKR
jgi:DNA-binding GntR family transcriptional regulator